jgi:hypothetical protein
MADELTIEQVWYQTERGGPKLAGVMVADTFIMDYEGTVIPEGQLWNWGTALATRVVLHAGAGHWPGKKPSRDCAPGKRG